MSLNIFFLTYLSVKKENNLYLCVGVDRIPRKEKQQLKNII
jgi:hypothetical protein